jgi:hypothetical protein
VLYARGERAEAVGLMKRCEELEPGVKRYPERRRKMEGH